MFCKNCGNELGTNEKFCTSCGSKIEMSTNTEPKEEVKKEILNVSPIVENSNNSTNINTKVEKLKGLKIASLVLGIISLVFFLLNIILIPLELTGLILAIVYIVNNKKFCAGIVLNIIAMIISVTIFFLGTTALVSFAEYVDKNPNEFGKKMENFLDDLDKQLDKNLESSLNDTSKKIQDAKNEIQKAKDEIKVYTDTDTKKTSNDKYATGYKYVGSAEYGYIKVPDNWVKFIDVESNNTIQYSYANVWIATIYASNDKNLTAYKYAKNVYDSCKNDGAKSVSLVSQKIVDKYYGYKVSCYYEAENVYLTCFIFADSNNVKHYVSIEGPEKNSEYLDLINTFSLEGK